MAKLQAPVYYPIGTSPTRAGRYDGPYTIINYDANAGTVWVADNAGLAPGQGTPIYPGTSLIWEKSGDLWVVGENNTTQIILSYDTSMWQPNPAAIAAAILNSGVLIIDDPIRIANGQVLTAGQTIDADISKYQSLILSVSGRPGNTSSSEVAIRYPSTGLAKRISMAANALGWSGVLPLLGEDLQIAALNGGVTVTATLSHRPYVNSYQVIPGAAPTFYLVKNSAFVANGASTFLPPMRPFFGDLDIRATAVLSGAPAGPGASRINVNDSNGDVLWWEPFEPAVPSGTLGPPASPYTTIWRAACRIPCQGDQLVISASNAFTAPITMTVQFHVNPVESIVG